MASITPSDLPTAPAIPGLPPQRHRDPIAWCQAHDEPYRQVSDLQSYPLVIRHIDGTAEQIACERPRMYLARMSKADIVPPTCAVWTSDDCLYVDGLGTNDSELGHALSACVTGAGSVGTKIVARPRRIATSTVESVFFGGHAPPGHFLGQDASRLALAAMSPETSRLPIAVYDTVAPRNLEYLDLLSYPASRRIIITTAGATHFDAVWLSSSALYRRDALRSRIWPDAIWWLRSQIAPITGPWPTRRPRIAIPRVETDWRRAVNQSEINQVLERHNIVALDFESMSAIDRIHAVAYASLIVTFGGVGGELTMLAPPDCVIVEVAAPGWNGIFGPVSFAGILGQPFFRLVSTPATRDESIAAGLTPPNPSDIRPYDRICHFRTDCDSLAKVLLQAGMRAHQTLAP